jgi:hypothetical protein
MRAARRMAKVLKMLSTEYGGFRGRLACSCGSGSGAAGERGRPVAAGDGSDDEEPMPAIRQGSKEQREGEMEKAQGWGCVRGFASPFCVAPPGGAGGRIPRRIWGPSVGTSCARSASRGPRGLTPWARGDGLSAWVSRLDDAAQGYAA